MMKPEILFLTRIVVILFSITSLQTYAETAVINELLSVYSEQSDKAFSEQRGKDLWYQDFQQKAEPRSCTSCHTDSATNTGRHIRTGKSIDPISPITNPERLTDKRKIEKWLKRNCKWTIGRECTAQEKGDILVYLLSQ